MAGDTFQKFKSSLNRGVTTINIKTASSLEKAKIKTHIESINSEVQQLTFAIGEAVYAIWESGSSDFSALNEKLTLIKQKKGEVASLEMEYASIDERNNQILGNSSVEEALVPETVVEKNEVVTCPNCGSSYSMPVRFCRKCGCKLQE